MSGFNKLTSSQILRIYRAIEQTPLLEEFANEGTFADFVASIWDIHNMPSEDDRYRTKYEDIVKHYINNRDYTYDELFLSKLRVQDDNKLEPFLKNLADIRFFPNREALESSVKLLNEILSSFGMYYKISGYDEHGMPIYTIQISDKGFEDPNLPPSGIHIKVEKNPSGNSNLFGNHEIPNEFPCLLLVYNEGWNDYNQHTSFDVFFYQNEVKKHHIGKTKLIIKRELLPDDWDLDQHLYIAEFLQDEIDELSVDYCSLGQSEDYYRNLSRYIPDTNQLLSLLWNLKDVAAYPTLQDLFENEPLWDNSLIRYNEAESMLRIGRLILSNMPTDGRQTFTYRFKPNYGEIETIPTDITFDFDDTSLFPRRIFALIGKNGCGKTQLLSSIPQNIKFQNPNSFVGRVPSFSKIIAVSNSYYDTFEIPKKSAEFNYIYCGLSKYDDDNPHERIPLKKPEIIISIIDNCETIKRRGLIKDFIDILKCVFDTALIEGYTTSNLNGETYFNTLVLDKRLKSMSSGELSLFYIFSTIVRNIRLESLILFDEPENHLHPNAISKEISAIYTLLRKFNSYAIIATHSPLIISEIRADNVFLLDKEESMCNIRKIGVETLGANLGSLTNYVFNNNSIPEHYKQIIKELKRDDYTYSEIVKAIQSDDMPLNLPLSMYLNALFSRK